MNPVPREILDLVKADEVEFDSHAMDRIAEDNLSRDDAINAVLNGEASEPQTDDRGESRWVWVIIGPALSGRMLYTAGKILEGADGTFYYFITVKEFRRSRKGK